MKTVGDLAREIIPEGVPFDCALPWDWVKDMLALGADPRGNFVWVYDEAAPTFGRPFFLGDPYPDQTLANFRGL